MADLIGTSRRKAVELMIEAGLSLEQAQKFISQLTTDYVIMNNLADFIKSCGGRLGQTKEPHPSWQ